MPPCPKRMGRSNFNRKRVLLAIPSFQDPRVPGKDEDGPILKLVGEGRFDEVVLVGLQVWRLNTFLTRQALNENFPNVEVKQYLLPVKNVSDYQEVFYALKGVLDSLAPWLRMECEAPVVLLPPSICEQLLDCWLLLLTSLNIQMRICQVESHYAAEGFYWQDAQEESLEWLNGSPMEFRDSATEKILQPRPVLNPKQIEFFMQQANLHKHFSIYVPLKQDIDAVMGQMAIFAQAQQQPYLHVACEKIPEPICDSILLGYRRQLDGQKSLQKKGVLEKVSKGMVSLSGCETLTSALLDRVFQTHNARPNCRYIGITRDKKKFLPQGPLLELPIA